MEISNSLIVFRKNNISDYLGALIFRTCSGCLLAGTEDLTEPDEILINDIINKDVLIVGSYYNGFISKIKGQCNKLEVYYNSYESQDEDDVEHDSYKGDPYTGFSTFSVKFNNAKLREMDEESYNILSNISRLIDDYIYGFPSEESLNFNAGVHGLSNEISNIEKLALVTNKKISIEDVIKRGKENRGYNLPVIKQRVKLAQRATVCNDKYQINVCLGDDNIFDTCLALCKETGIGMIINFDTEQRKTNVYCRVSKESGYKACEFIKEYLGGTGTLTNGNASVEGLLDIYKLFY